MEFVLENITTVMICAMLAVIAVFVIRYLVKKKKHTKSCGGGCGGCAMSKYCHRGRTGKQ